MNNRRRIRRLAPHDPVERDGPCPLCDEPWPCEERKRQRIVQRQLSGLLRQDLYEPVEKPVDRHGTEWVRWRSPLGWQVDLTYGEDGVRARVLGHNAGTVLAVTRKATVSWLDGAMP